MRAKIAHPRGTPPAWRELGPGMGQLTPARARFDIDEQLSTAGGPLPDLGVSRLPNMTVSIEVRYGQP